MYHELLAIHTLSTCIEYLLLNKQEIISSFQPYINLLSIETMLIHLWILIVIYINNYLVFIIVLYKSRLYSYLWIVISNFYIYCFSTEVLFQFAKTFNWHLLSGFQVLSMNFCQHIFFVHFILRYDFFEILFSYLVNWSNICSFFPHILRWHILICS